MAESESPARLGEADYARFRDLVREKSGLEMTGPRRADLERALRRALTQTGLPDLHALDRLLRDARQGRPAIEALIAALTVGETHFFRNRAQFEALEQHILPELIARRRPVRRLRLWSAGCSSGEEAYSLAILVQRLLPDLAEWNVVILATDINPQALAKARRGVYGSWSFREVPPEIQAAYFRHEGPEYEIIPAIRDRVTFAYLNLVEEGYPSPASNTVAMDLILCRNVFIYFSEQTSCAVAGRLYQALAEDGWLVAGHAELSQTIFRPFSPRNFPGTVVYQKAPVEARELQGENAQVARTGPAQTPATDRAPSKVGQHPARRTPAVPAALPSRSTPAPPPAMDSGFGRKVQEALELWQAGQPDEAVRQLEPLTAACAEDPWVPYYLARIYADRLDLDTAQTWIELTLRRDPLLVPAHYLHGLILQEAGRLEDAVAAFRRCIYADTEFVLAEYALARLYARQGQRHRASIALDNVARALADRRPDAPIPEGDGLTVEQLLELVAVQR